MATQVQFRRGTTAETALFTGAIGEVTVDTVKKICVVHDGLQLGGYALLREDGTNSAFDPGSVASCALKFVGDPNTGLYSPGSDQVALVTGGVARLIIDASGSISVPGNFALTGSITAPSFIPSGAVAPINGVYLPAANTVAIATNGTGQLYVNSSGYVGIGISSPTALLHVAGTAIFQGLATFQGDVALSGTGYFDLPAGTTAQRPGSPNSGMMRFNTTLTQFEGYNGTVWGQIGGGATGGGTDAVFFENGQNVTTNYTLTTGKNAVTAGPCTINSGVTVTIPSGQSWVIV